LQRLRRQLTDSLHSQRLGPAGMLALVLVLPATARCTAHEARTGTGHPTQPTAAGDARPAAPPCPATVATGGEEVCAPASFSCPPWRWLGCHGGGVGCACPPPTPEIVYPRFHPVPTRPVFAPPGTTPTILDDGSPAGTLHRPLATPEGRPLEIEVLPPAPVPEQIVRPQPEPEPAPEDRMTGVPRGLAPRPPEASWIFPMPTGTRAGRMASYPDHPGPSVGPLRR
jgi:hypothetical protein